MSFISCYIEVRPPSPPFSPGSATTAPPTVVLSPVLSSLVWRCNVRGFEMTKISNINTLSLIACLHIACLFATSRAKLRAQTLTVSEHRVACLYTRSAEINGRRGRRPHNHSGHMLTSRGRMGMVSGVRKPAEAHYSTSIGAVRACALDVQRCGKARQLYQFLAP